MTSILTGVMVANDTVGDIQFTLSNNDRSLIRNMVLFIFEHTDMDKEDAVELIEFSNRVSYAVLEELEK